MFIFETTSTEVDSGLRIPWTTLKLKPPIFYIKKMQYHMFSIYVLIYTYDFCIIYTLEVQRLFFEWFFRKDYCFSRDLQSTIQADYSFYGL